MAGIYGKITEHPEYPITDERRFTVEIKPHKYQASQRSLGFLVSPFKCAFCGYEESHKIHQVLLVSK